MNGIVPLRISFRRCRKSSIGMGRRIKQSLTNAKSFACCVAVGLLTSAGAWASERLPNIPLDGPRAAAAAVELRRELLDPQTTDAHRQQVASLLGRIGEEAVDAIDDLVVIVETEPDSRRWALKALSLFGVEAARVAPVFVKYASDRSLPLDERMIAAEALARTGPIRPDAATWFYQALQNRSGSTAETRAVVTLAGLLGPAGDVLTPSLLQKLDSSDAETRRFAARSLGEIGSSLAIDGLVETMLDDDNPAVADAAAAALDQVSGRNGEAFAQMATIGNEEDLVRVATYWKRPSTRRTAAFQELLDDKSRHVRFAAAQAMLSEMPRASTQTLRDLTAGDDRVARDARVILRRLSRRDDS